MPSTNDPPDDEPRSSHRGMIPREDLPFLPQIKWRFWAPVLAILVAFPLLWGIKRDREAQRRREQLLREHASLTASLGPDYRSLRRFIGPPWWRPSVLPRRPPRPRLPWKVWPGIRCSTAACASTRCAARRTSVRHLPRPASCLGVSRPPEAPGQGRLPPPVLRRRRIFRARGPHLPPPPRPYGLPSSGPCATATWCSEWTRRAPPSTGPRGSSCTTSPPAASCCGRAARAPTCG